METTDARFISLIVLSSVVLVGCSLALLLSRGNQSSGELCFRVEPFLEEEPLPATYSFPDSDAPGQLRLKSDLSPEYQQKLVSALCDECHNCVGYGKRGNQYLFKRFEAVNEVIPLEDQEQAEQLFLYPGNHVRLDNS